MISKTCVYDKVCQNFNESGNIYLFEKIFWAITITARKTRIYFSNCFEKMVFPIKIGLEYDLSCIIRKDDIPFSRKYDLILQRQRKDDLSQKNTWKYEIFFKCSEKIIFPKNSRLNMIFFVISGKMVSLFSRKYDIFSLGGK